MLVVANNRGDCLMRLHKLLEGTEVNPDNVPDLDIEGITSDSRKVGKGFLFAALKGVTFDGQKFIPQAIENGEFEKMGFTFTPNWVRAMICGNPGFVDSMKKVLKARGFTAPRGEKLGTYVAENFW